MWPIGETPTADEIDPTDGSGLDPVARLNNDLFRYEEQMRVQGTQAGPQPGQGQGQGLYSPTLDPNIGSVSIDGGVMTTGWKMFEDEEAMRKLWREQDVQAILQRVREAYAYNPDETVDVLGQHGIHAADLPSFLFAPAGQDTHEITIGGISADAASGGPGGGMGGWG